MKGLGLRVVHFTSVFTDLLSEELLFEAVPLFYAFIPGDP
jgi:hypothetical protein